MVSKFRFTTTVQENIYSYPFKKISSPVMTMIQDVIFKELLMARPFPFMIMKAAGFIIIRFRTSRLTSLLVT